MTVETPFIEELPDGIDNILNLRVRPELMAWHRTGLDWFDMALGGNGLRMTQSVIYYGGPGAGKSTITQQLADAMTGCGFNVLYNGNEEYLFQVAIRARELGLKHGYAADSITNPQKLTDKCDTMRAKDPTRPFVLLQDSLQTLNDGKWGDDVNSKTPVRCMAHIFNWCKQSGAMAVVINQSTKGGQFAGSNKLKHLCDTFGHLAVDIKPKSPTFGKRLFGFEKNRMGGTSEPAILDVDRSRAGLLVFEGMAHNRSVDEDTVDM